MRAPGIRNRWRPVDADALRRLPGSLGVYEIADGDGRPLAIGLADSRERFGLRSAVATAVAGTPGAARVRIEETIVPATRLRELEAMR